MKENTDILIVDDEIDNIRLLTELLEKEGYSVRSTYTALRVFDSALVEPPSLILLDARMPEIDGFEVCRRLKQDARTRDIPVLFVSALNDFEARIKAFEAGGVDFITKPYQDLEILARVKTHLRLHWDQQYLTRKVDESTSRYRMFLEHSLEGIWCVNFDEPIDLSLPEEEQFELVFKNGYVAEANDAYAQHVGFKKGEELVGSRLGDFISRFDLTNIATVKSWIRGRYTIKDVETIEHHKDGVARIILNNAVGIIESGHVVQVWGTHSDITERKQAEKALQQSRNFNKAILNTIKDHIAVTDNSGCILAVNDSWMNFARDNDADLSRIGQGVNYLDVCRRAASGQHSSETERKYVMRVLEGFTAVLNGDVNQFISEYQCNSPTEARWFQLVALPFSGEKGGLVVAHRNITDLKTTEEKLLEAERKYRTVADFTYDWEYWELPDGRLPYISPSCERITGYSVSDFVERPELMSEIVVPEDREIWGAHQHGENNDKTSISCRFRIKHKDGGIRWIAHVCQPVYTVDGDFDGVRSSNRDITELQRAERMASEHLTMLADLDRRATLGQLTGSIAHELNQPLTGILSGAQAGEMLLERERFDLNQIKEIFSDIVSDTKRASLIIQHLRELFAGQTGNMVTVDVNSLILETLQLLNSEILSQSVVVQTNLTADGPHVQANRIQLQQVLINLIRNACEALQNSSRPERMLEVKTICTQKNELVLSLVDNGPGIDPAHLENIFEPLSHPTEEGMGMGLAICKTIIRAHQGKIWAENTPEGGAHFYISLPIRSGLYER